MLGRQFGGAQRGECAQNQDLASAIGVEAKEAKQVTRLGLIDSTRPRLLRLKCETEKENFSILRMSKNL